MGKAQNIEQKQRSRISSERNIGKSPVLNKEQKNIKKKRNKSETAQKH
jgi:hypothetical protein